MPIGPGIYDGFCTAVREAAVAEGVVLIVINGKLGSGFSVQATVEETLKLPGFLRDIANEIDKIHGKGQL